VLKIGLIGCGGRGTGAAVNALNGDPNTKLTALADVFPDQVARSREQLKLKKADQFAVDDDHCFSGFDAYKQLIDSGVDVVVLAATPHFRPRHLKACVDAGKHVFCEKPVAVDAPGVRSVMASSKEAEKKGLCLVSGLCWRYHFGVKETMQRVLDGAIGDIVAVQESYNTGHVGRSQVRKPEWSEMEYQIRNWYFYSWLSGDHNVEQHIHSLDKASWVMGDKPPVRAWGLGGREVRTEPKFGNIFDHHAVVYEYESGARVYAYCRQQDGTWRSTEDYFFGTKGTCNMLNKYRITGETEWKYDGPNCNMYDEEHKALFAAIRSGNPINNGQYMATSTMLAILGRMVTYTGQAIEWDTAINSQETLSPASYSWDADPPVMPMADGSYPIAVPGVTKLV
ncbi:MAG: Gfo/Idh/MocA family oxidoreductase, partial [Planctomycetes bacterium]|nr:Gfo/Idh/MocA family oxidoreductase [Planctomycetota bacterium]